MQSKLYSCFLSFLFLTSLGEVMGQANTTLSNLTSPTAINQDLLPAATNVRGLGNVSRSWKNVYIGTAYYLKNTLTMHATGTSGFFAGTSAGNLTLTGAYNAGLGANALAKLTTGTNNTGLGFNALNNTKTGVRNTAVGNNALYNNTTGGYNVAMGNNAMFNSTTGSYNVAIGEAALNKNKTGSSAVAIGDNALYNNDNNYNNVAVGSKALYSNTTGGYNVAIGYRTLYSNKTSGSNTAIGYEASYGNTSGSYNTAIGYNTLRSNTTGSYNQADGAYTLYFNTTGTSNSGNGYAALYQNTTGNNNTASGYYAMLVNSTGSNNTAAGYYSMYNNTTGVDNTAVGAQALQNNSTGAANTALGRSALLANTGGANTAMGYLALTANSSGTTNTGSGANALYANTTGGSNSSYGYSSLPNNTTGNFNTGLGKYALYYNTTQAYNTAVGYSAGDFKFGTNNTFVGAYASPSADGFVNSTALGYNSLITASNQIVLGSSSVTSIRAGSGFVIYSDGRFKKDLKENVPGLEFINLLKPVTYTYDVHGLEAKLRGNIAKRTEAGADSRESAEINEKAMTEKEKIVYTGFVAQEVEKAAAELDYNFSGVYKPRNETDVYGLSYSEFVVPLVKAVQELSADNKMLREKLEELELVVYGKKTGNASLSSSSVDQNSPNPFKGSTVIGYTLPQQYMKAMIIVYDATGRTIKQIGLSGTGRNSVRIDATTIAAGEYNYSLFVDNKLIETRKMISIK